MKKILLILTVSLDPIQYLGKTPQLGRLKISVACPQIG
jgi:hypothetical protein